jgi:hypothetical protein
VVPKERKDKVGNATTRPILAPVFIKEGQDLPNNARHRADHANTKYKITTNYVFAWYANAIIAEAYAGGSNNRCIRNIDRKPPYGMSVSFVQNVVPANNSQ